MRSTLSINWNDNCLGKMIKYSVVKKRYFPVNDGRNPFNQNFRAEVRNFLGIEWIVTGPKRSRSIPLAKRFSR